MTTWFETREAARAIAQRKADAEADPCPACGAPADVELIDVSWFSDSAFVAGEARCSAYCWLTEPERYVEAVKAHNVGISAAAPVRKPPANEGLPTKPETRLFRRKRGAS